MHMTTVVCQTVVTAIKCDVGQHFRVTSSTAVCGAHFTTANFSTGAQQGSGEIKLKTRRLKKGHSTVRVSTEQKCADQPRAWKRHLQTLPFEMKVSTCATEVDTLKTELAQTKDLERAKEEVA